MTAISISQVTASPLAFAARAIALLSPGLAYSHPRHAAAHRAEVAAQQVEAGAVSAGSTPGLYRVKSATKPGVVYEVNLEDQSCECQDWFHRSGCHHLIAAALWESMTERCPICQEPMEIDAQFFPDRHENLKRYLPAWVCRDCEYAREVAA
jgi:hypothetical protein